MLLTLCAISASLSDPLCHREEIPVVRAQSPVHPFHFSEIVSRISSLQFEVQTLHYKWHRDQMVKWRQSVAQCHFGLP